jgi:hypothetical protein
MASKTAIANMALSHLGVSTQISDVDTERSQEANTIRAFWDVTLDYVLRAVNWRFATKIATLGLVEEDPDDEWSFSYRMPSDAVKFRKIQSGIRIETADERVPFRIVGDDTAGLIYTDMEDAIGEYTRRVTNPELYPADFALALSYKLASLSAASLTGGDPYRKGNDAEQKYVVEETRAAATGFNEEQQDPEPENEYTASRN